MKKKKQLIYLYANPTEQKYICTGISADDVWQAIKSRNMDIVLIKSDVLGDRCINNFEIINECNIDNFLLEYTYGDLCFIDCNHIENLYELDDEEIAEMLFIGHMSRPLRSPFIGKIGNKLVYIGHDNDYFCKLYCVNDNDFYNILKIKLHSALKKQCKIIIDLNCSFLNECKQGLLIDLNDIHINDKNINIPYYVIGKFDNMDEIINNSESIKENKTQKQLHGITKIT